MDSANRTLATNGTGSRLRTTAIGYNDPQPLDRNLLQQRMLKLYKEAQITIEKHTGQHVDEECRARVAYESNQSVQVNHRVGNDQTQARSPAFTETT